MVAVKETFIPGSERERVRTAFHGGERGRKQECVSLK